MTLLPGLHFVSLFPPPTFLSSILQRCSLELGCVLSNGTVSYIFRVVKMDLKEGMQCLLAMTVPSA